MAPGHQHANKGKQYAMKSLCCSVAVALAIGSVGCTGDVETTDDSIKVEAEVPKVEVGEETPDLDPRTDGDVDVDTPLPGDK
jgi:hypothetical protein